MEVWPESLGAMLEYWYIERGLFLSATYHKRITNSPKQAPSLNQRKIIQFQLCPFHVGVYSLVHIKQFHQSWHNSIASPVIAYLNGRI